jgi:hypothetical protein
VCKVIARALAPRAAERFATAGELHDAFQTAMTEAGACASAKDVQAFVATHLGERISARKRTIQIALEAAEHRDKLAAVIKGATLESTGTIVIVGGAANGAEPPSPTAITQRVGVTSVDEYAATRAVNDAVANGFPVSRHVPLDSAPAVLDQVPSPADPLGAAGVVWSDGVTGAFGAPAANGASLPAPLDAVRDEVPSPADPLAAAGIVWSDGVTGAFGPAAVNGSSLPQPAPLDSTTIEPARARPTAVRIWVASALVLGMAVILGTLGLLRAENDVIPSPEVTKVVDSVGTGAPLPSASAILPATVPTVAGAPAVIDDAGSAPPPAPSSTESTPKVVGPLPGTARPRLAPRSGEASPRRVKDDDGI